MKEQFTYTQVFFSESDYYVLREGGNKPTRILHKNNKDVPEQFDNIIKFVPIEVNETEYNV
jgi:hypothetical protein